MEEPVSKIPGALGQIDTDRAAVGTGMGIRAEGQPVTSEIGRSGGTGPGKPLESLRETARSNQAAEPSTVRPGEAGKESGTSQKVVPDAKIADQAPVTVRATSEVLVNPSSIKIPEVTGNFTDEQIKTGTYLHLTQEQGTGRSFK
ncbi:hypothetical protein EBR77_03765 [bacterium]|nr:hypothetical protein [bacterium]